MEYDKVEGYHPSQQRDEDDDDEIVVKPFYRFDFDHDNEEDDDASENFELSRKRRKTSQKHRQLCETVENKLRRRRKFPQERKVSQARKQDSVQNFAPNPATWL